MLELWPSQQQIPVLLLAMQRGAEPMTDPIKSDLPIDSIGPDGLPKIPLAERLKNFKEALDAAVPENEKKQRQQEKQFEKS